MICDPIPLNTAAPQTVLTHSQFMLLLLKILGFQPMHIQIYCVISLSLQYPNQAHLYYWNQPIIDAVIEISSPDTMMGLFITSSYLDSPDGQSLSYHLPPYDPPAMKCSVLFFVRVLVFEIWGYTIWGNFTRLHFVNPPPPICQSQPDICSRTYIWALWTKWTSFSI